MGVGVDETGQSDQAPSVDRDRARIGRDLGQEFVFGPDENDVASRRSHPAVLDEADLPQGPAALGQGTGAGQELPAAGDDAIS
jgi:hypothetical protein